MVSYFLSSGDVLVLHEVMLNGYSLAVSTLLKETIT